MSRASSKPRKKKDSRSDRGKTLALWGSSTPGLHIYYNPMYGPDTERIQYWGHLGIATQYEHFKNQSGETVKFSNGMEVPKKNIHFPEKIVKDVPKYLHHLSKQSSNLDNERIYGPLPNASEFGDFCRFDHWNALVNTIQYDENHRDIWGDRKYPCGGNLPGSYFERDDMQKEVTFIAIIWAEPSPPSAATTSEEEEEDQLEDFIGTRGAIHTYTVARADKLFENYPEFWKDKKM